MNAAIIPARGGSKRIPRKNVRPFAGQPMISYSVRCAVESGLFDRVVVSTDDDEIASVAQEYGAEVPFRRPAELSDDHTATTAVIAHAVRELQRSGTDVTAACCIYATAPFVRTEDLAAAKAKLEGGDWRYVFAATSFGFPIFRGFRLGERDDVEMFYPKHFGTRSQDLPEAFHDAGQFYWGRPEAWLADARIFDRWSTVVRIPRWRVQDIDTPEDWERAEMLMRMLRQDRADA